MTKYLLKRRDEYLFVAPLPLGECDDPELAERFGSRLGARLLLENRLARRVADDLSGLDFELVPVDSVKPRPKKLEYTGTLQISEPLDAVQAIYEAHAEYCERVSAWLIKTIGKGGTWPACKISVQPHKWSGLYSPSDHSCHYPVAFAMIHGMDSYRTTVDHEVVHAYQRTFSGTPVMHDGCFAALMEHAAGRKITQLKDPHDYSIEQCVELCEVLLPWWGAQRQRGVLQSLPCEVTDVKIKRKGVFRAVDT